MDDSPWSLDSAREHYNLEGWGVGYFDIDDRGRLTVHPTRDPARGLGLHEIATDLEEQGVALPLLLRFPDILRTRIEMLSEKFGQAMDEYGFDGGYTPVYPIKVNQQRHVLDELVAFGEEHGVGLEVGSKPELHAVLALTPRNDHMIVCNGYKDREYMRLALVAQRLGHEVMIVIEKIAEVDLLLEVASEMGVVPSMGVRIKLTSAGAGRWSETAGDKSKFGLSAMELMRVVEKLRAKDRMEVFRMIHFHLGSQIPDVRNIKQAMTEVARYYVELRTMGIEVTHVDVGGGLGVDYDGSRSTGPASVNYSVQEYANDVVFALAQACRHHELPMPHIITESGRALTAHHAMLLVRVIDLETQVVEAPDSIPEDAHPILKDLWATYRGLAAEDPSTGFIREAYHDASWHRSQLRTHYNTEVLGLEARALGERIYLVAVRRVAELARKEPEEFDDLLPEVEAILVDRYFCNFSLFQSLPDSWAIDQLFPIVPVHRLDEEPVRKGTLQDVTCDSDGKIDRFIDWNEPARSLSLHPFRHGDDYILGIFLVGAYQEILGDLHNLFGDTNAVHIHLDDEDARGYEVAEVVEGDTVSDVLRYVQYDPQELIATLRRKIQRGQDLSRTEANAFVADYVEGLAGYTYLDVPVRRS
ncbi:MAG: biosynthetic arginine decarboxylase [Gemmatimonadales bacterium]|nr:MAG: biosynthetic arginine decarboxylase [Gemmatimonadales bacterium]